MCKILMVITKIALRLLELWNIGKDTQLESSQFQSETVQSSP